MTLTLKTVLKWSDDHPIASLLIAVSLGTVIILASAWYIGP